MNEEERLSLGRLTIVFASIVVIVRRGRLHDNYGEFNG